MLRTRYQGVCFPSACAVLTDMFDRTSCHLVLNQVYSGFIFPREGSAPSNSGLFFT